MMMIAMGGQSGRERGAHHDHPASAQRTSNLKALLPNLDS